MITLVDVSYSYPPGNQLVLRNVSLRIEPCSSVAIMGPAAAGKTTLAKLIKGMIQPTSGQVIVNGDPRLQVGYVGGDPGDSLVGVSVEEDVAFGLENARLPVEEIRERVRRALTWTGLLGMERRLTHALSGGEQQKVALAGWLALGCRVLIIDEALSMLDRHNRNAVRRVLRELRPRAGVAIIEVTNSVEDALFADRVVFLSAGSIRFDGQPRAFVIDPQVAAWANPSEGLSGLAAELFRRGAVGDLYAGEESLERLLSACTRIHTNT